MSTRGNGGSTDCHEPGVEDNRFRRAMLAQQKPSAAHPRGAPRPVAWPRSGPGRTARIAVQARRHSSLGPRTATSTLRRLTIGRNTTPPVTQQSARENTGRQHTCENFPHRCAATFYIVGRWYCFRAGELAVLPADRFSSAPAGHAVLVAAGRPQVPMIVLQQSGADGPPLK